MADLRSAFPHMADAWAALCRSPSRKRRALPVDGSVDTESLQDGETAEAGALPGEQEAGGKAPAEACQSFPAAEWPGGPQ